MFRTINLSMENIRRRTSTGAPGPILGHASRWDSKDGTLENPGYGSRWDNFFGPANRETRSGHTPAKPDERGSILKESRNEDVAPPVRLDAF